MNDWVSQVQSPSRLWVKIWTVV